MVPFGHDMQPPRLWNGEEHMSPSHGSSVALIVYGGAQRAISLATGFLTGESTWNPPHRLGSKF